MATYNFLDKTGLGQVWAKIKALIPTKTSDLTNDSNFVTVDDKASTSRYGITMLTSNVRGTNEDVAATQLAANKISKRTVWYGTCDSGATDQVKNIIITSSIRDDFPTTATIGMHLRVRFTNGNTQASNTTYTLNISVNGGSAYVITNIRIQNTRLDFLIQPNEVVDFVFTGATAVRIVNKSIATTTYYGLTKLSSSVSSTSTDLAATPSAVKQAYDLASERVPSTRTVNGKALSFDITLDATDVGALPDDTVIPTKTSDLTNDSGFITGYTETDPVFSASPAAGITATDISNWNAKVSDDKTWNGVALTNISVINQSNIYVPFLGYSGATNANLIEVVANTTGTLAANRIPKYNNSGYLVSTTPSANDNSTKVATTAYVDSAISGITDDDTTYTISISSNRITLTPSSGTASYIDLPVYDGSVSTGGGS